jgi:DNA processing protein
VTLAALRLARTEGVGTQTWRRLLERFGSAEAALDALPAFSKGKLSPPDAGEARREHDAVLALGGQWLVLGDAAYPPLLAELYDAPPVLAALGDPALLQRRMVGIVGARNASAGARRIAEDLAEGLAKEGLVVASGLARGVDAAAHHGALLAGATVACVAGGLDLPYPPENAALQARIAEAGVVVAEAPLGTAPLSRHFPKRNRIIAGLSLGVVVIEAAPQSGTLITARMALEAGRELYAVPGSPLDPRCRGSNDLLRQGAHLVENAEDVLAHLPEAPHALPLFAPRRAAPAPAELPEEPPLDSDSAAEVLDLIGSSPVLVDEVMRRCHLSASAVQAILLDLELSGRVALLPGNRVARAD